MITIDNFSVLIELIASISIGFVAIEYVKSYTRILCEKVFQYEEFICKAYDECRILLTDKDTLACLEPIEVGGSSTIHEVERIKLEHENLHKEIGSEEDKQKKAIIEASQSRSLSSICFYVFLSNIVLLWGASFESQWNPQIHYFCSIYCFLSILYLASAWLWGEKEKAHKYLNFSSLRYTFICFIVIILLTLILSLIITNLSTIINGYWWVSLVVYIVLSYLNFAVFAWKINKQAKRFKSEINTSKERMKGKCTKAKEEVQDLLAVGRVKNKLSV